MNNASSSLTNRFYCNMLSFFQSTIDKRQATLEGHIKKTIKFNSISLIVGMVDIIIPASCIKGLENQVLGVHMIANGVASGKSAGRKEVINTYVCMYIS